MKSINLRYATTCRCGVYLFKGAAAVYAPGRGVLGCYDCSKDKIRGFARQPSLTCKKSAEIKRNQKVAKSENKSART